MIILYVSTYVAPHFEKNQLFLVAFGDMRSLKIILNDFRFLKHVNIFAKN